MRKLKASLLYFAAVFLAGFVIGMVRVPFLVPSVGVRLAELLEMPLMLVVIVFSARCVLGHCGPLSRLDRLFVGLYALALLAAAELSFAAIVQGQSPMQYISSRDPVSGSVYLAMLVVFAVMPALQRDRQQSKKSPSPTG